eukprot:TRINITY_DN650_c8_g1_i1.p1 TRINITY_DN650_c8_g1~~TRINITY_DN650_c8_g1_i1.p1  ORF type:complete len:1198 (+),score=256.47 TRINITY_DN650_c8_g1_i1:135-3596(+)
MHALSVTNAVALLCIICVVVSAAVSVVLGVQSGDEGIAETEDAYKAGINESLIDIEQAVVSWAGQLLAVTTTHVESNLHAFLLRFSHQIGRTANYLESFVNREYESEGFMQKLGHDLQADMAQFSPHGLVLTGIFNTKTYGHIVLRTVTSNELIRIFNNPQGASLSYFVSASDPSRFNLQNCSCYDIFLSNTSAQCKVNGRCDIDWTAVLGATYDIGMTGTLGVSIWTPVVQVSIYSAFVVLRPFAVSGTTEKAGVITSAVDMRLVTDFLKKFVSCDPYTTETTCLTSNPTCKWDTKHGCYDAHSLHIFAVVASDLGDGSTVGLMAGTSHGPGVKEELRYDPLTSLNTLIPIPIKATESPNAVISGLAETFENGIGYSGMSKQAEELVTVNGSTYIARVRLYDSLNPQTGSSAGVGIRWWIVQAMQRESLLEPLLLMNQRLLNVVAETSDSVQSGRDDRVIILVVIVLGICLLMGLCAILFAKSITEPLKVLQGEMALAGLMQLEDIGAMKESKFYEITDMQSSFKLMVKLLKEHRAFVPQAVLQSEESTALIDSIDESANVLNPPSKRSSSTKEVLSSPSSAVKRLQLGLRIRTASIMVVENNNDTVLVDTDGSHTIFVKNVLETIRSFEGTVIQLAADSCVAAWNTHRADPRHAIHSCYTGSSLAPHANVGIDTGKLLVGSIGDSTTRTVSVSGPAFHLSKSLPSLVRRLGLKAAITEETFARAKAQINARPIDNVTLLCTTSLIYELLGANSTNSGEHQQITESFFAIKQGRYGDAISTLSTYLAENPADNQGSRLLQLANSMHDMVSHGEYSRKMIGWEAMEGNGSWEQVLKEELNDNSIEVADGAMSPRGGDGGAAAIEQQLKDATNIVPGGIVPRSFVDQAGAKWQRSDKLLGKGAYGSVWAGMGEDGGLVALKTIAVPTGNDVAKMQSRLSNLLGELRMLAQLRHDCIVTFIGSGLSEGYIVMAMEYLPGGSLYSLLKEFGPLPVPSTQRYLKDILKGLKFLHKQGIVHRDMKPHNVLLLVDGQCKLADFGASSALDLQNTNTQGPIVGTPVYMSPEAARGFTVAASDIWATGVSVVQLLAGKLPYTLPTPFQARAFLKTLSRDEVIPEIPPTLSQHASDFCSKCFLRDPEVRPVAEDLLLHPFLW